MTGGAFLPPMTPVEWPPRVTVIETLCGAALPLPTDEREVQAGVIGMATRAALLLHRRRAVQATPPINQPCDLFVAVEAEAGHLLLAPTAPTGVTLGALQRALQPGVRARQRSRRNLGADQGGSTEADERQQDDAPHPGAAQSAGSRNATWRWRTAV